jgi:hypothetical protein
MNIGDISLIHHNHPRQTALARGAFVFKQVASVGLAPHDFARSTGSQSLGSRFTGF